MNILELIAVFSLAIQPHDDESLHTKAISVVTRTWRVNGHDQLKNQRKNFVLVELAKSTRFVLLFFEPAFKDDIRVEIQKND